MRLFVPDFAVEARRQLGLAWPVMLTSLNWTLLHLVDVAIVGHAGTYQLGALAAARTIAFITIVSGIGLLTGVLVFSARADGAGDRAGTSDFLRQGLIAALLLAVPCLLVLWLWAEPLIVAVGVAPEFAASGGPVIRAMALGYPAQFLFNAGALYLEGISRPRRVMVVNLGLLPLNALLAWAWTGGHLGLPAWGAVGAASATTAVAWLGLIVLAASILALPDAGALNIRDSSAAAWLRALRGTPALLRFGAVPALGSGLELAGFSFLMAISTRLGDVAAAAFQTIFSLHNLAFAMALGWGSAAGVRVGNAVGANERDQALGRTLVAAAIAMLMVGTAALGYFLFAPGITAPFSDDPRVRALSAELLRQLAIFIPFDGLQLCFMYALRSLGDQVAAGVNGIVGYFLVTGGLGWWFFVAGCGAAGLVWAAGIGMIAVALLQGGRMGWISRPSRSSGSARASPSARRSRRN